MLFDKKILMLILSLLTTGAISAPRPIYTYTASGRRVQSYPSFWSRTKAKSTPRSSWLPNNKNTLKAKEYPAKTAQTSTPSTKPVNTEASTTEGEASLLKKLLACLPAALVVGGGTLAHQAYTEGGVTECLTPLLGSLLLSAIAEAVRDKSSTKNIASNLLPRLILAGAAGFGGHALYETHQDIVTKLKNLCNMATSPEGIVATAQETATKVAMKTVDNAELQTKVGTNLKDIVLKHVFNDTAIQERLQTLVLDTTQKALGKACNAPNQNFFQKTISSLILKPLYRIFIGKIPPSTGS
jgi:hypothetical protein